MARKKLKNHYRNPRAPVFDISAPRKEFYVAEHACITVTDVHGDNIRVDGRRGKRDPDGDWTKADRAVMLTEDMATYFGNLGYIEVELDFGIEKDVEIAALQERIKQLETAPSASPSSFDSPEPDGSGESAEGDDDEAGTGSSSDSGGGKSSSGPSGGEPTKDATQPRRRRQSAA